MLDDSKGPRLSISGWFHGPPLPRPPMAPLPSPTFISPKPVMDYEEEDDSEDAGKATKGLKKAAASSSSSSSSRPTAGGVPSRALSNAALRDGSADALTDWINPTYLRPSVIGQMQAQFARDASLEISEFIRPDKYAEVMRALGAQRWAFRGPANVACYKSCYDTVSSSAGSNSSASLSSAVTAGYNSILPDPVHRLWRFMTGFQFQVRVKHLEPVLRVVWFSFWCDMFSFAIDARPTTVQSS